MRLFCYNITKMAMESQCPFAGVRVLVLNAGYQPVKIVNWRRAMILWFSEKVDVIEHYDHLNVHTVSKSFSLPSVIRVKRFVKNRYYQNVTQSFKRQHIFLRDNHECQYCGKKEAARDLTLDHVLPVKQGGGKSWENLVTACRECNQKKGARSPEEAGMPLRNLPQKMPANFIPDLVYIKKELPKGWKLFLGHLLQP